MKTKLIQKIKEKSLKEIAKVIKSWFKLDIGFAQAHKEIGDVIEKAISQSKKELVEEIKNETEKLSRFTQENRRRWTLIECGVVASDIKRILEDLNKK